MGHVSRDPAAGMRGVRVRVTARDIKEGKKAKCETCPVARAINRHLKPGFMASVVSTEIDVWKSEGNSAFSRPGRAIKLPSKATEFIDAFDCALPKCEKCAPKVKPFAFNLPLPEVALRRPSRVVPDTIGDPAKMAAASCSCGHGVHSAFRCEGRSGDGVPCDCAGKAVRS